MTFKKISPPPENFLATLINIEPMNLVDSINILTIDTGKSKTLHLDHGSLYNVTALYPSFTNPLTLKISARF